MSVVPEYCTCGAKLPPDARFCHKCGKPQFEEPLSEPEPQTAPPQILAAELPAEISFANKVAVRIGFLAALLAVLFSLLVTLAFPPLQLAVFLPAGFMAVRMYRRRTGQRVSVRNGVRLGWITGVFSFAIFIVQVTIGVLTSAHEGGLSTVLTQQFPRNDQHTQQILEILQQPPALALILLLALALLFAVLTALPMLGGLIGAKMMAREQ